MTKTTMTVKEFADYFGISIATVNRKLPAFEHLRIGRRVLFDENSIRDFREKFTYKPKTKKSKNGGLYAK